MAIPLSPTSESLPFQKVIDARLEFESRQTRAATEATFHANLVETTPSTLVVDFVRGDRSSSFLARGRGFRIHLPYQICGRFGHMAQKCYYRFDRDYGGPSTQSPTMVSVFSGRASHGSHKGGISDGWCLSVCDGPVAFDGPEQYVSTSVAGTMEYPYDVIWGGLSHNSYIPQQSFARFTKPFLSHREGVGQLLRSNSDSVGSYRDNDAPSHLPHELGQLPRELGPQFGPNIGLNRPIALGCVFGPYDRPVHLAFNVGQNSGPNANCVGLEPNGNFSAQNIGTSMPWRIKPRARVHDINALPCIGLPRIPDFHASVFFATSGSNANTTNYGSNCDNENSYIPMAVGTSSWCLDSGDTHHIYWEAIVLHESTPYSI
ncbi:hypothetical protein PVK06_007111 [Gossypium arboreum]|uniref:Uncharacterized protein n=1 Tax=Gossypium arboreum TaxID=29729 RepID=A0ABR0QHB0_GOSAR|nr:hypothetical protein PVK06_007111 [Gossypium arboreum]